LIRVVVVALGAAATVMALGVQSVQALWFFTTGTSWRSISTC
jgi:hypothetical protein